MGLIAAAPLALLLLILVMSFVLTDSAPLVEQPSPPGADQVGAARAAEMQVRKAQKEGSYPAFVQFDEFQLAAIGALASDGLRPDRLLVETEGHTIQVVGSHKLAVGRWLNVAVVSQGSKAGFPTSHVTISSWTLPGWLSRLIFETTRFALNLRGAGLPPLDRLVQNAVIEQGKVTLLVQLPRKTGILDQLGGGSLSQDENGVLQAYCRLTQLQKESPTRELAVAVRRAFPADQADLATANSNRSAFIALAMLAVSPQVGELVGLPESSLKSCRIPNVPLFVQGRTDSSMHWTLSAALAATTGVQISQAMGEWKELSDSLSKKSRFAYRDPTGFSFVDISADRSGFLTAQAGIDATSAKHEAARLARIDQDAILPPTLLKLDDGLPNAVFVARYGNIRDPRFLKMTAYIDSELNKYANN